ncbi:MAG: helix-turn-helix domain-containing protein [Dermatophilaceae bacterium]
MGGGDALTAEQVLAACGALRRRARRLAGTPFAVRVTGAQVELIRHVRRHPDCSVGEAAEALGVAGNTVSTLVRELTRRGVLVRRSDPQDGRIARLRLAEGAGADLGTWLDRRTALVSRGLERLTPEERETLARAIPALVRLSAELEEVAT